MTGDRSLHDLAAGVVANSPTPDPSAMVMEFVRKIDPADYEQALHVLARDFIRRVIHNQRGSAPAHPAAPGSRKVAAVREAWRRVIDGPEFVPSTGWLFLRDATRDQVLEIAGMRQQKSEELQSAASRFCRLADAMESYGAIVVADLPEDVLSRVLTPVVLAPVEAAIA